MIMSGWCIHNNYEYYLKSDTNTTIKDITIPVKSPSVTTDFMSKEKNTTEKNLRFLLKILSKL
jgi:hypothetical protein